MTYSDPLVELDETLRQSGDSGYQLRLYLLRHFSELLRQLACNLDAGNLEAGAPEESTVESSTDAVEQVPAPSVLSLAYSDHAGHPFRVMRDTIPIDAGHLCVIKLPFMIWWI